MSRRMGWELGWTWRRAAFRLYRIGPWPVRWVELAEEGTWTHIVSVRTWGAWRLTLTHRELVASELDPWADDIGPVQFWEEL